MYTQQRTLFIYNNEHEPTSTTMEMQNQIIVVMMQAFSKMSLSLL